MNAESPALQLGEIAQIALTVDDLARATAFYRDRLGVPFLFEAGNMAFFDCGGVRLLLGTNQGEGEGAPRRSSVLYFRVQDIEAAHRELTGRGVVFVAAPHRVAEMPDHELWMAFFEDTEGNTHALSSEVPRPSAAD